MSEAHTFLQGHTLDILRTLPAESVQCAITSPPYLGLRDYGISPVTWVGREDCLHTWKAFPVRGRGHPGVKSTLVDTQPAALSKAATDNGSACLECGAWKGSLGQEPTVDLYVQHLVEVFREVRRVLRKDGTCWLNMGNVYAGSGKGLYGDGTSHGTDGAKQKTNTGSIGLPRLPHVDLKPKNLVGLAWRVAFALQADGWWLRSDVIEEVELYCPCGCGYVMEERIWRYGQDRDIIWWKPNTMPGSQTDRSTSSHEYVFLLSKSARYFYDAYAVSEPVVTGSAGTLFTKGKTFTVSGRGRVSQKPRQETDRRTLRSVWRIPTQAFAGPHPATFPEALVSICMKAGTSEHGCCGHCGKPWERLVAKVPATMSIRVRDAKAGRATPAEGYKATSAEIANYGKEQLGSILSLGFRPACSCPKPSVIPCVILDPFAGSGTVALVAKKLGRRSISIEINPSYIELAKARVRVDAPTLWEG